MSSKLKPRRVWGKRPCGNVQEVESAPYVGNICGESDDIAKVFQVPIDCDATDYRSLSITVRNMEDFATPTE